MGRHCRWLAAALLALVLASCTSRVPEPIARQAPPDTGRLHALLLNGGGSPAGNYQSHAIHIQQMLDLLRATGVAPQHITVFNSDGSDPGADQSVREESTVEERWRLLGTRLDRRLISPVRYLDTAYAGVDLRPATQAALQQWFEQQGRELEAGDTLLLYVTDHGNLNRQDASDNTITLWGKDEHLSVRELTEMLQRLDAKVRVVALMSQCFSGSFGGIIEAHSRESRPTGNVCGYFASTADRPAYGCYPENRGRKNVGHSFRFFHALAETGSFAASHERVLVEDDTPDVPLRTSELFLATTLKRAAERAGKPLEVFADELLQQAWRDKSRWQAEIRLLDRIGQAYGYFSPRSLAELADPDHSLPQVALQTRNLAEAWGGALGDANQAELRKFLEATPAWAARLSAKAIDALSDEERRRTAAALLPELQSFTRRQPQVEERLQLLQNNSVASAATSYRMSVRLGISERMRYLLTAIAGQVYLHRTEAGSDPLLQAAAEDYQALVRCEDLRLPPQPDIGFELAEPKAFPRLESDIEAGTAALPSWMGIRFQRVRDEMQKRWQLSPGAAMVVAVFPDSPAARAGLEVGDIVVGPPGQHFRDPGEVRWWTMLSPVGKSRQLEILRDGEPRTVAIEPAAFPLRWPELPGPPRVG
ncbi:MAG TPA: PDZ domain-containing protein, partial [Terriglobales bacterium]|nr:PDZ domain-containing protein [Terriglobales bacterium]